MKPIHSLVCIVILLLTVSCQKTTNSQTVTLKSKSEINSLETTNTTSQEAWLPALISQYLNPVDNLSTSYPLTVIDSTGREVTIAAEPQRIISLLPSATENLCALGSDICSRLVGRDPFSNYPAEVASVAEVGSIFDPNQELIVAAQPDLVFSDNGVTAQAYNQRLIDLGINVIASKAATYSEVFDDINRIGQVMNRQAEAQTIVSDMQREITAVRDIVQDADKPTVVYYSFEFNGYGLASSTSFIGSLIEQANGENLITDQQTFPVLSAAQISLLDPDLIITGNGTTTDDLAALPGWSGLRAVTEGNVFALNQAQRDVVIRPTPRMVDSIKIFARIMYPNLVTAPF